MIIVAIPKYTKGLLTLVPKNKDGQPLQSRTEALDTPRGSTPDLLPSDVTGSEIYREQTATLEFQPGPLFGNLVSILRLVGSERASGNGRPPEPVAQDVIFAPRREVGAVYVAESAERYMVDLVIASREPKRFGEHLAKWIHLGASPRATIALDAAARARAWLRGNDFVSPEDIQAVAPACLAHRIHLSYEAEADGKTREDVGDAILQRVAVT